ncbi:lytic transglycosylase domain-containing protein [Gluconacetobacter entanii]|uniref:Murein transglycosylase n=1 Tax=Gluconacetobacter entanii TaxID=108528 RepID=A0A318PUD0_9PROT|nr:lytic transglycosylase domain-containing protein [Gluconacetobacter entanii]PYD63829.1 murein transglycosylase [Gluconacetobacter entanii]
MSPSLLAENPVSSFSRSCSRAGRWLSLVLLVALAACAGQPHEARMSEAQMMQEADSYRARARQNYTPPGPPEDPWGPYITEAAKRFDVPDLWIRAVMQRESGGHLFHNGQFVTSQPGAMGLMQLMPPTYDEMRRRYDLGADAYEPHDNIIAGTAYLRQMYDIYGSPGFLAAYNSGPGRLDDFIDRSHTLPRETREYVAYIGPRIAGVSPVNRSQADLMIEARSQARAQSRGSSYRHGRQVIGADQPLQVAEAPSAESAAVRAAWSAREKAGQVPMTAVGAHPTIVMDAANWAVQVGAYGSRPQALQALQHARASAALRGAREQVDSVTAGRGRIYRARLLGLSHASALQACQKLGSHACQVMGPISGS